MLPDTAWAKNQRSILGLVAIALVALILYLLFHKPTKQST